ncbi:MAG: NYN domain-containing protein [Planctomycetota bacterium]|nr:NYN domain-containing protein [Planctomycetota bacterium]
MDNSNLFIEGQRLSAVKKRMARDLKDAIDNRIIDHGWQPDYGRLHALVCGDHSEIGVANLWGSPPPYDSFWRIVESKGFKVTTYDKSPNGTEKKVDVAIAYQMTKDAFTLIDRTKSEITLVSGDKDFVPVVEDLKKEGFRVCVAFWAHAARELRHVSSSFFDLDPWHGHLTR